jgi:hypothetical protein
MKNLKMTTSTRSQISICFKNELQSNFCDGGKMNTNGAASDLSHSAGDTT